ncbi:MAG: GWxTD domain-containing protein [Gemmatimonadetes bacterium]|nr:GWxTD domain-containing protein [Gemmatimonadota bacterium]
MKHNRSSSGLPLQALAILALAAGIASAAQAVGAQRDGVRVRHARFWRGDATLLEGRIGLQVAAEASLSPARTVELVVRDAAGNTLHRESWEQSISARTLALAQQEGGIELTIPFTVALAAGSYAIGVASRGSGAADSVLAAVESFPSPPLLSDLVLSSGIRVLGAGEAATAAEMQKGRYAIEQGTRVTLTPFQPRLWYYFELYAPLGAAPAPVSLRFSVWPTAGRVQPLVRTERTSTLTPPGGVETGGLDLAGLPPGEYRLVVEAEAGGRQERRETEFTMAGFETQPLAPAAQPARAESREEALLERYFAAPLSDDATIRQFVEALIIATPAEPVAKSVRELSPDGQRRFLARYWARLDRTPATEAHELLEEWMGRVEYASRNYAERDIGRPGVQSDRGRIYLKYGEPDEKLAQPTSGNREVEIWKYTRQRHIKFAFLDESGFQHFRLVMTTDPFEASLPDWMERVADAELIRLILRF